MPPDPIRGGSECAGAGDSWAGQQAGLRPAHHSSRRLQLCARWTSNRRNRRDISPLLIIGTRCKGSLPYVTLLFSGLWDSGKDRYSCKVFLQRFHNKTRRIRVNYKIAVISFCSNREPTWSHPGNFYRTESEQPIVLDYIFFRESRAARITGQLYFLRERAGQPA